MPVEVFAPASVTTVFVPRPGDDGSLGVSFALDDGVTATVEAAPTNTVTVDGSETTIDPVTHVLEDLGVTATVDLDLEVPIGPDSALAAPPLSPPPSP